MVKRIPTVLTADGQSFTFDLRLKREIFDGLPIQHWWIDIPLLYGQRSACRNRLQPVADYYWARCKETGYHRDNPDAARAYTLAKLVPLARNQGSRRVFPDAFLTNRNASRKYTLYDPCSELESLLRRDTESALSPEEFFEKTAELLGPPRYDREEQQRYLDCEEEFLGKAAERLRAGDDAGWRLAERWWQRRMKQWGKKAGFASEKTLLDVFSYECRAALHQAYSSLWVDLVLVLSNKYGLPKENQLFLLFWHTDLRGEDRLVQSPNGEPLAIPSGLFHNHIFGLHPGTGIMLRTSSGQAAVGRWLRTPSEQRFGQLLNAIFIALSYYDSRRQEAACSRRGSGGLGQDPEEAAARLVERLQGRKRLSRRNRDGETPDFGG